MINYDDLFILNRRKASAQSGEKGMTGRTEPVSRRFDAGTTFADREEDADLDRRESVLNARIAEFENLVRKTKFSASQQMEKLSEKEKELIDRWEELQDAIESLTRRESEISRREAILERKLEDLSQREADLRQNESEFETRSRLLLQKINDQKEELAGLIATGLHR